MKIPSKALIVFGTRPEAIKLAPVIKALGDRMTVRTCVTAQHRQMLDQVLQLFEISPDYDLDLMRPGQDLSSVTCAILQALQPVIDRERPDVVVVQGDTTTTFAAALAAFYSRIPVAHVEAGLRTLDKARPFPEEINRRLTGVMADWHFAPTQWASENLAREGIPADRVFITGNTGIDALFETLRRVEQGAAKLSVPPAVLDLTKRDGRVLLVTGHRRESFGAGFRDICRALRTIVDRNPDVSIVYPVHRNPNVQIPVHEILGDAPRVLLIDPLDYVSFVWLMRAADLILTDSGGVQEEAPSLGKPVLVMRETTERPEGVDAGVARLVGTDYDRIVEETERLLNDRGCYDAMARAQNPYGDGLSAGRVGELLSKVLSGRPT